MPAPTPTPAERFLSWRFGLFVHFGPATFNERDWATGHEDLSSFAPDHLDCAQWAAAARSAGMRYAVFTAKHTDGVALWPTRTTRTHSISACPAFRHGRGDLVREFLDAFRREGIAVGLYYCLPGDYAGENLPPGSPDLHGLAPEARDDFEGFISAQLRELLSDYGPLDLLWLDQFDNRYTVDAFPRFRTLVKSLQPDCVLVANNCQDSALTDVHSYEYPWMISRHPERALPPEGNTHPAEICDCIAAPYWFWNRAESASTLKPAAAVLDLLRIARDRRANYLLNAAPDRSGLIPPHTLERLAEIGARASAEGLVAPS